MEGRTYGAAPGLPGGAVAPIPAGTSSVGRGNMRIGTGGPLGSVDTLSAILLVVVAVGLATFLFLLES